MLTPVTAILLLSCPDQKGLVATVSDFICRHDGNIIHADQHTDQEEGIFLQRVEFQLEGFDLPREQIESAFAPIAERFGLRWSVRFSDRPHAWPFSSPARRIVSTTCSGGGRWVSWR